MKYLLHIIIIIFLTLISQVGGALYFLGVVIYKLLKTNSFLLKLSVISIVYLIGTFIIIPPLAKQNNRVPLPVFKKNKLHVSPHTMFTVLTNRHYVRPELRTMLIEVGTSMHEDFPGINIQYLDANYPLFKKQRMLPHLKHDNGKKLDVNFIRKKKSGKYSNRYFSFFGYGFSEEPKIGEHSFPQECANQGKWQYNIIEKVVPDQKWRNLNFPIKENKELIKRIAQHQNVRKVFIEPHLKTRLGLSGMDNIRFHGCWAVRHDDHMHIEMR